MVLFVGGRGNGEGMEFTGSSLLVGDHAEHNPGRLIYIAHLPLIASILCSFASLVSN